MSKHGLVPPTVQRWTRIDDYLGALARRRTARKLRRPREPTEPEGTSLMLSTLPFAALLLVLALLVAAFAVAAWPPSQPRLEPKAAERRDGTAPPGWLEEAKKEMPARPG